MRVRLVHVTTRRSGRAVREQEIEVETLRVGRGTDNAISLPGLTVGLHHADFHLRADGVYVEPVAAHDVRLEGHAISGARRVRPGDRVGIAGFELRVRPSAHGEDLALEVEELAPRTTALEDLARRTRIGIEHGLLARRPLSWLLALAVLASFGAAPFVAEPLRKLWNSGPISSPHRTFEDDCTRCHATAFERVRDEVCLECHAGTAAHTTAERRPALLDTARCAGCHVEHRGRHGLAQLEQAACVACHADLKAQVPETEFADVSDFVGNHPELRLSLVIRPGSGERRRESWESTPREDSGLRFSHLRHVGQVVSDPATGQKRNQRCGECHVPDGAGRGFQPISFEEHCRSCHSLSFEKGFEKREALHGDPARMRDDLREFYARLALAGEVKDPAAPAIVRRAVPGRRLTEPERKAALRWAEAAARRASDFLMNGDEGECGVCHTLQEGGASDGLTDVAPVEVAVRWLPHARFAHAAHEPSTCRSCHPAAAVFDPEFAPEHPRPRWSLAKQGPDELLTPEELRREHGLAPSEESDDVLLPGIETCRECHAGADARLPMVASDCVQCHAFHRPEFGPLRERAAHAPARAALGGASAVPAGASAAGDAGGASP